MRKWARWNGPTSQRKECGRESARARRTRAARWNKYVQVNDFLGPNKKITDMYIGTSYTFKDTSLLFLIWTLNLYTKHLQWMCDAFHLIFLASLSLPLLLLLFSALCFVRYTKRYTVSHFLQFTSVFFLFHLIPLCSFLFSRSHFVCVYLCFFFSSIAHNIIG